MDALDDVWEQLIAEAKSNPLAAHREGLAEFIAVKSANDELRERVVASLLGTMRGAAEHAARKGVPIVIESGAPHRFKIEKMTLGGELLRFRRGVRCLTVEAGWTRTPQDGFMRGGALAVARLTHFGLARANEELHLLRFEDEPRWFAVAKNGTRVSFEIADLIRHFRIFLELGAE